MLRNRYFLIFAIFMIVAGIGYDIYYFKVAKHRKVMKSLGREPARSSASSSTPAPESNSSSPVAVPEPGAQGTEAVPSDSDRVILPLSNRLLNLVRGEKATSAPSNPNPNPNSNFNSNSKLPILDKASFVNVPRSNRNPFLTFEEERMSKGSKNTMLTTPKIKSPILQETPNPNTTAKVPTNIDTNEPKPQPTVLTPTVGQPAPPTTANMERKPPPLPNLNVSAIIINGDRKVAIIEGQRVTEGSLIGMEKVVEIKPDRVVLQSGRNSRELALAKNRAIPLIVKKEAR